MNSHELIGSRGYFQGKQGPLHFLHFSSDARRAEERVVILLGLMLIMWLGDPNSSLLPLLLCGAGPHLCTRME